MPRFRWLLAFVLAAGAALLVTYRAEVATWVMQRAMDRNLAADPIAELTDGLHLAVCGAGSPLPVYGPAGVEQVVSGFNQAYALDAGYRTAHHGATVAPPGGAGMVAQPFAAPPAGERVTVWQGGGITVSTFPVPHDPVAPAVGYRFDYAGRSLVISGDTRRSDTVTAVADGVDLLAHEALAAHLVGVMTRAAEHAGRDNVATITRDILDYHTTPEEAAAIAAEAGVGHLLLYHIVPPLPLPGLDVAFLEGVAEIFAGPVTLSRDGTFVSLPAGSAAIDVSNRL